VSAAPDLSLIPPLGEPRPQAVPEAHESVLPTGLRLVVVPRPGVPLIELRLRVPFAAATAASAEEHTALGSVLSGAVLLGTSAHDQTGIAELLQTHGAELSVSTDPDRLLLATTLLPDGLAPVLGVLAELLTDATYPDDRVEGERDRVAERIAIARSQPGVIARSALAARRYGDHPYAITLPDAELVAAVDGEGLRALHRDRVLPTGSTLVLVGDLDPRAAADAVGAAMAAWSGSGHAVEAPPAPSLVVPGIELVDRPGAVQSNLRLGGRAPGRTDPDLAAARLANMIFGGYFSSRLVENIRERRGYTYSPRSSVDHQAAGSSFLVEADVATEVTGPALLETWYELGRMALLPVTDAELDGARRYILGSMALSTATHAGLASTLSALVGAGLPPAWLAEHQQALAAVTVDEVREASRHYLASAELTAVVVGDADQVADQLRPLAPVSVTGSTGNSSAGPAA
jgi:predicted Zn-dependent peptidase